MKRLKRKLDNYFTDKLKKKIKDSLCMYYIQILFYEGKDGRGDEVLYVYINRLGNAELKNPRPLRKIYKSESFELLFNNDFLNDLKTKLETTLEMISKCL